MRGPVRYCIYILNRYQKELAPDQVSVATMHTTPCYGGRTGHFQAQTILKCQNPIRNTLMRTS